MSAGCYDFTNKRWLVGPEIKDMSFDPYANYFDKDMKYVDDIIDDIREIVLTVYELSIATLKTTDKKFKDKIARKLATTAKKAKRLFD